MLLQAMVGRVHHLETRPEEPLVQRGLLLLHLAMDYKARRVRAPWWMRWIMHFLHLKFGWSFLIFSKSTSLRTYLSFIRQPS